MWDNMDIPNIPGAAIRHFQFIVLGIWPVNLLTLAVQDHSWSWQSTPQAIMGLWEWGAFVAFSLALAAETGGKMFFALAEHRRKMANAREEGRQIGHKEGRQEGRQEGRIEGRQEGRQEGQKEAGAMLDVLEEAARINPAMLPFLLREYQLRYRYRNGAAYD